MGTLPAADLGGSALCSTTHCWGRCVDDLMLHRDLMFVSSPWRSEMPLALCGALVGFIEGALQG